MSILHHTKSSMFIKDVKENKFKKNVAVSN
jgi:hypothetical protein